MDKCSRFLGGLRREIQDILDYKEWTRFPQLFHLALKAEREVQGRQPMRSITPSTPSRPTEVSKFSNVQTPPAPVKKSSPITPTSSGSATPSSSSSAKVICHRCKGMGHIVRECPSKRTYIATDDGGYVSASDEENDFALAIDTTTGKYEDSPDDVDEVIDSVACTANYLSILVQQVLSTQVEQVDKLQRHNLFQMFLIVNNCRVRAIIDGGSNNNLVSSELAKTLGLTTRALPHPYHVQWFNNSGKAKVTQSARVHFSIGSYHDYADFDVVPVQACSLLLGRPWQYDNDVVHHGRQNRYTFMHKGKTIALLPLTPAEIMQYEKELTEKKKHGHDKDSRKSAIEQSSTINMKGGVLFAFKSVLADHDEPRYALTCTSPICSIDPTPSAMPLVGTNLL
jgi:hypothetical protein